MSRHSGLADFSAFYASHAERVLVYMARRCLDPELAVDLMAETFAVAFTSREAFRGASPEEAEAWVFGIARNQLANYFRRGGAERRAIAKLGFQVPALDDDEHARIEDLADLTGLRAVVADRFDQLPADQQAAVRLRVVEEMPYSDVALCLEVSEEACRARVSRGLRQLAAWLEESIPKKGTVRHE